jgi:hypothetical protein
MTNLQLNAQAVAFPGPSARENTDGVIASYIHEISQRHRPSAGAPDPSPARPEPESL